MANLFERGNAMLSRRMAQAAGLDSVTVTRSYAGSLWTFTIEGLAWFGNPRGRMKSDDVARVQWDEFDLMMPAALYRFSPADDGSRTPSEPLEADSVTVVHNGRPRFFRVLVRDGEPAATASDTAKNLLRVRLKETERAPPDEGLVVGGDVYPRAGGSYLINP